MLAAGTLATASYAALFFGIAVLAPDLRRRYGLSLTETGIVLAAPNVGSVLSLISWGLLADRIGERIVIAVGLAGTAAAVAAAGWAGGLAGLSVLLGLAGALGAGVNSASGRAVLHWFGPERRGFALGIRQTAIPIGGFAASLVLPHLSLRSAFLALAAGLLAASALGGLLIREGPAVEVEPGAVAVAPLKDPRMWRLSGGSTLMLLPQICLVGFLVLFLHERRGFATASAGLVLAVVQALGIVGRIAAGRWSDALGSRIVPLRRLALALAGAVALVAALVGAPTLVLVPLLVLAGALAMSWNSLSFTAAAETAGHARSGAALGLQQTALALASTLGPIVFAALVAASSWEAGFAVVALGPLAAYAVLGGLAKPAAPA